VLFATWAIPEIKQYYRYVIPVVLQIKNTEIELIGIIILD
jgi:hypothetical protein